MSFIRDLLSTLAGEAAVDYGHRYFGQNTDPIATDTEYVRVWLRSARITAVRRWAQKFYPAVHARFVYADPMTGMREVLSVSSPHKTFQELDPRHLDRFVVVNQPLLGPIPYRGELSTEVALFSVAADNLTRPYLDLLFNLTTTASVSYLSAIEPFIAPIKRGAETLLYDSNRAELEIGLSRTDTALVAGNIVVARTEKNGPGLKGVSLDPDDWRLLGPNGQPVADFPYLVIGIERLRERTDFRSIPDIRDGWKKVWSAATGGRDAKEVLAEFENLQRVIRFSPDLVPNDRKRVSDIYAEELRQAGLNVSEPPGAVAAEARPPVLLESIAVEEAWRPEGKIPLAEARRMVLDPAVPDYVVRSLFTADPNASQPFSPAIVFDPDVVAVEPQEYVLEGARLMNWANELASFRRRNKFLVEQNADDTRPVLVSVGDSWFQFPVFLSDVIDQLGDSYAIWSLDAAGDTLANMVLTEKRHLAGLRRWAGKARALLLSGSGNDIVGEDPDGISVLTKIVRPFEAGRSPAWHIDTNEFRRRLAALEACFREVFESVAREFPGLPVICHGYDHAIPAGPGDPRRPLWAKQDEWLAGPFSRDLGIRDPQLQRAIVAALIDRLNDMLAGLCGGNRPGGGFPNAWYVDVRGKVQGRWADELHPTDAGFSDVARTFGSVIEAALRREAPVQEIPAQAALAPEAAVIAGAAPAPDELDDTGGGPEEIPAIFAYREALEQAGGEPAAPADLALEAADRLLAISPRAYDLIVRHETGGRAYYEGVYKARPVWPGEASGVTIGFGYDLGYYTADAFDRDWSVLPAAVRQRLKSAVGKHGKNTPHDKLRELLRGLRDIVVGWELAEGVFRETTLPQFIGLTQRALPNAGELTQDSFGALVSLTFNRGAGGYTATQGANDRFREMRGIRAALKERRFSDIPALLRLMKRVWQGTSIAQEMNRRRENEALLFERGLTGAGPSASLAVPEASGASGGIAMSNNDNRFCVCLTQGDLPATDVQRLAGHKAALLRSAKWEPGDSISIRFLGGSEALQERVKAAASEWTRHANLTLDFRNQGPTAIRIAFRQGNGSWSYLGTMCLQIQEPQPTMNYGWLTDDSDDDELRRVVLHEFGHALGLIHEHQNPKGGIRWNRDAVVRDLSGPPNNWNDATIENNIFTKYPPGDVVATDVDRRSIMLYPIPRAWTENGYFSAGLNKELSELDKLFAGENYPR